MTPIEAVSFGVAVRHALVVATLAIALLAGCSGPGPDPSDGTPPRGGFAGQPCVGFPSFPNGREPQVVLHTNLGDLKVALFFEAVPVTVASFIDLVRGGFYNGTSFHRINPALMLGGDPNTKDADPSNDGYGGPGFSIRDEFHHALRHAGKGVVSMASVGPDTAGSQFFITFGDLPQLDDQNTVFGQVIEGLDVLDRIKAQAASEDPQAEPRMTVILTGAEVVRLAQSGHPGAIGGWSPDDDQALPPQGGTTAFLVVAENCSGVPQVVTVQATGPGASWAVERGMERIDMAAGQRVAFVVTARMDEQDPEESTASIALQGSIAAIDVPLTVRRSSAVGPVAAEKGTLVRADYIGLMEDGRAFATTRQDVADNPAIPRLASFASGPGGYTPLEFVPGGGGALQPVQGFQDITVGTPQGGSNAGRIAADKAYASRGCEEPLLCGRNLMFQVDVVDA